MRRANRAVRIVAALSDIIAPHGRTLDGVGGVAPTGAAVSVGGTGTPPGAIERANAGAHTRGLALVVLPDPDARVPASTKVLGATAGERLVATALRVGFDRVLFAPGTTTLPPGREVANGDRIAGAALVVLESATIRPGLLELMVAHPLEDDERYTLYDAMGRPVATFCNTLSTVPATLPISEELPYPDGIGADDVARLVEPEDIARSIALVIAGEGVFGPAASWWRTYVGVPTLRWMTAYDVPLARLELLALVLVAATLPLTLIGGGAFAAFAAVCLLAGVHTSKLIKSVRVIAGNLGRNVGDVAGERLCRAARPLGHAAMTGGLTYALLAQTDRADIAGLVLLAAGAGATMLALVQSRFLLRGREATVFALPDAHAVASRTGVTLPPLMEGAPLFELVILLCAIPGEPAVPWAILLGGAAARLWRWYAGPLGAAGD